MLFNMESSPKKNKLLCRLILEKRSLNFFQTLQNIFTMVVYEKFSPKLLYCRICQNPLMFSAGCSGNVSIILIFGSLFFSAFIYNPVQLSCLLTSHTEDDLSIGVDCTENSGQVLEYYRRVRFTGDHSLEFFIMNPILSDLAIL